MVDFRKKYTKYIKETTFALAVGGDIDQENPVNPDDAKEIEDILRKKGVRAEVTPSEKRYSEVWIKSNFSRAYIRKILEKEGILESLEEKIKPYMVSYSDKYGKHYGFEDGDTLRDIQDKAQKLRKKGFQIDKMGRYNPPIDKKYMTGKTGVVEGLVEGFVPLVPLNMRYMNKKKAQDAIDKVSDNQGNIRFVKHFQNDTVGLVKFIYGDKEVKNFEFQFPGIYYKKTRVTFHDLILKAREKVNAARKILGLGRYKEEKEMKEAFPKPKEDKEKKIKDLENKVQKLEVEKSAELNPEPNPDTGEIPLQIGVAYKYLRDKAKGIVDKEDRKDKKKETEKVKVGKKTLTNKKKEKIDVEPEMDVM